MPVHTLPGHACEETCEPCRCSWSHSLNDLVEGQDPVVSLAGDVLLGLDRVSGLVAMPAVRWSLTWQWNSQMPALSGAMSATIMLAGSRLTTSMRIPPTTTSLPCQCGVYRSTSVLMLITYQRTCSPFLRVTSG